MFESFNKINYVFSWTYSVKVFKNGPSKSCGRQPFKSLN